MERIIAALGKIESRSTSKITPCVYIATVGEKPKQTAFKILYSLRQQGIFAEINYQDKSLKGQMRLADKLGFKYVAILGEEELGQQTIVLRDMQGQSQKLIKISNLVKELGKSEGQRFKDAKS